MNLAIITRYLPSTSKMGVGYQAHYMANAMVRRGHVVCVYSICPKPDDALYDVTQIEAGPPLRSLKVSWKLRRIDWSRFDVVHAHGDDWFLWNRQVPPHVRTVHGSCLSEAVHIPGLKSKLYMLWLAGLETMSCMVADKTVGVSQNTCRSYPWIKQVIPNGVDLSAFRPGEKETVPTILFVGTYHNRKRGKWLMEVFQQQIRPTIPDARLWMVCTDAPTEEGVEVLGRLSMEELADRYRRAWLFCLPSTYEGFGVPYIEAMASGTAVVATPNVGALEVLESGKHGAIVEDADLGRTLCDLLGDRAKRLVFESNGGIRSQKFSLDSVALAYESVYQEVISNRAGGGLKLRQLNEPAQ